MSKKAEKDFNKQLNNNKDMPKIIILTEAEAIKRYGGELRRKIIRFMIPTPFLYWSKQSL